MAKIETGKNFNKPRDQFARELLSILDGTLYKLLSTPESAQKSYERTISELSKQKKEVAKRGSREAITNVLAVIEQMFFSPLLDKDSKRLLEKKLKNIRRNVRGKGYPSREDVRDSVALVVKIFDKIYPGKSVHEIRNQVVKIVSPQDKERTEAEERARRIAESGLDREEVKKIYVSTLYDAYYHNGYYSGIPHILRLPGSKAADEKIIRAAEADIFTEISEGRQHDDVIIDIRKKIGAGIATEQEKIFYLLSTNEMRPNWFGKIPAPIESLVDLGEPVSDTYAEKATEYMLEARKKARKDFDQFTPEDYELMAEEGYEAKDESVVEKISKNDIIHARKLVEMTIAHAYPEVVQEDEHGHRAINRRALESMLGKEPLPEKFIVFMKENDPTYPG